MPPVSKKLLVNVARAKAVQQRADNAPHVGVVVDHEEAQAIEIDADHGALGSRKRSGPQRTKGMMGPLRNGLGYGPADGRRTPAPSAHRQKVGTAQGFSRVCKAAPT